MSLVYNENAVPIVKKVYKDQINKRKEEIKRLNTEKMAHSDAGVQTAIDECIEVVEQEIAALDAKIKRLPSV